MVTACVGGGQGIAGIIKTSKPKQGSLAGFAEKEVNILTRLSTIMTIIIATFFAGRLALQQ